MKKNFGNGIVKKSIVLAMSVMLLATSPIMGTIAAENNQISTTDITSNDSATNTPDTFSELSEEVEALLNDIKEQFAEVEKKQENTSPDEYSYYEAADDIAEITKDGFSEAIKKEVTEDSEQAAKDAEGAAEDAKELVENVTNYETITDELLNEDETIVDSVEGNTDKIVETITKEGDILLNVENEDGTQTQVSLTEYTKEQVDIAANAVETVTESLNAIQTNSSANISEEREKIDTAIAAAETAKTDAETAYQAANSVLLDQIKRYNAYAAKYNLELYTYTDENGVESTPSYSEEELADLSDLTMNQSSVSTELKDLNENDLSKQLQEIKEAESLVDFCEDFVDSTNDSLIAAQAKRQELLTEWKTKMNAAKTALESASEEEKAVLENEYKKYKDLLDSYQESLNDGSIHPDGKIDSTENRFEYDINSITDIADSIDTMVQEANDTLYGTEEEEGAVTRYTNAYNEYIEIKNEYDTYLTSKQTIDFNFIAIKEKLKEAEAAVFAAHEDLVVAIEAVNNANEIKTQFEEAVANINTDSGSDSDNSDESSSSSSTPVTATPTVTLEDLSVPLLDTIPELQVPVNETIIIEEESVPLADSVPKTGDASAAAGAVGVAGLVTMLGALLISFRKKTLR